MYIGKICQKVRDMSVFFFNCRGHGNTLHGNYLTDLATVVCSQAEVQAFLIHLKVSHQKWGLRSIGGITQLPGRSTGFPGSPESSPPEMGSESHWGYHPAWVWVLMRIWEPFAILCGPSDSLPLTATRQLQHVPGCFLGLAHLQWVPLMNMLDRTGLCLPYTIPIPV